MIRDLSQTPLHSWHAAHGGRMVDFAGWSMPVQYASIVAEHNATRTAVGLFDVSHMGRFRLDGASEAFLDRVVTRQVAGMKPGQIRYSLVTNEAGGILDDVLVYHSARCAGQDCHVLVVNASNRQKIWDWLAACQPGGDVRLWDCTLETAMVAVQGPRAIEIVHKLVSDRSVVAALLHRRDGRVRRSPGHRQPHRLHRRRWLRADRAGRRGGRAVATTAGSAAPMPAERPPGSAAATRCGSKPACRSTATS